jgi:hypothetical protein
MGSRGQSDAAHLFIQLQLPQEIGALPVSLTLVPFLRDPSSAELDVAVDFQEGEASFDINFC